MDPMDEIRRLKVDEFDLPTTHKNDYRKPPYIPFVKYRWDYSARNDSEKEIVRPPAKAKCHETLTELRPEVYVPFNLCWQQKHPNLATIANLACEYQSKENIDLEREKVQETRPRVYVSPAVSIDDVEKETRDMIVNYVYTTDFKRAMKQAQDFVREELKSKQPKECAEQHLTESSFPCGIKGPMNYIKAVGKSPSSDSPPRVGNQIEICDESQMAQRWNQISSSNLQHPNKAPIGQDPLSGLVPEATIQELEELIRTNKLRLSHDKPIQNYDGYKPLVAPANNYKQPDLPPEHPMFTVYQVTYNRPK